MMLPFLLIIAAFVWLFCEEQAARRRMGRVYRSRMRTALRSAMKRRHREGQVAYDAGVKFATEAIRVTILEKIPVAAPLPAIALAAAPPTSAAMMTASPAKPHPAIAKANAVRPPGPKLSSAPVRYIQFERVRIFMN